VPVAIQAFTVKIISNEHVEYISLADAQALLGDGIEDAFHDAMHWAWGKWKEKHPDLLPLPSHALRAMTVHELTIERLRETLVGHTRVVFVEPRPGRRRAHFLIKDERGVIRLVIQSKKLDGHRRTKNIKTNEARRFDNGHPILGIPIGPRLTLGYIVVEKGTEIVTENVYRRGRTLEWSYPLGSKRGVEQLHLPEKQETAKPKRRVTAKDGVQTKRKGTADGSA
jgi:hypothetical protein